MRFRGIIFLPCVIVVCCGLAVLKAADAGQITAMDFLNASSVEDLIRRNPALRSDPPELFSGHKIIVQAILDGDIEKLITLFDKEVAISLNDVYYEKIKLTKSEIVRIREKRSIIYKFIFDHPATLQSLPEYVREHGSAWSSISDYIRHGIYTTSTGGFIAFRVMTPRENSMSVNTKCTTQKCIITGLTAYGG